ncbi:hypothetical protein CCH79_00008310 [Gambusia affinis]|uniref:All-trans-retinol 13,14-reductase n=1 Tax=Gambusia affinis TaxID=33528 RepID=A0A315V3Q6_GAMAF|nr:hypothetical protein CCH79_00008310 [Gambusia affinis]
MDHKPFRCMLDQMTNGQLQWEKLENPFDHVVLGPPENRRSYPIYSGSARYSDELKKRFPGEEKAIDEYLKLVKKTGKGIWVMAVLKLCPLPLAKFLIHTGLIKHVSYFYKMAPCSLTDVVNKLTENKDLRAVFTYIFGTYGNMPKDASFSMHSLLTTHYLNGAWYPKAGSSEIAYHMIPIIEKAGGAVLVRAPVNRILFNDAKEACGVSVLKGREEVHIKAPMVISDAGIFNTYENLLPKELQAMPEIQKQLSLVKHGEGGLSIFIGLNGTKEELGLKANNYWIFAENNFDELVEKYMNEEREEASKKIPLLFVASPSAKDPSWEERSPDGTKEELGLKANNYWVFAENNFDELMEGYLNEGREQASKKIPLLFIASPSAKDPSWEERSPGKSTLSLVSFVKYSWFEEWKDDKVTNRGSDYKELKQAFIDSALDVVMDIFPKITKDKIAYIDAGTPITNTHYIAAPKGEFYGLDHGIARFNPEFNATIRPQTPLKNLYLTGQDVFLCGFAGALAGALTCGSVILNRNLHLDSFLLAMKTKYLDKKLKDE